MVASQLRTVGVNDLEVVAAMASVPRELFVPAGREALAYSDAAIPLGNGRALMEPLVTGLLLTHARIESHERVLIVGAGTGYTAMLVGRLAARVVAVESDAALAAQARAAGVGIVDAELTAGAPDNGPYDVIYIDGAIERMPEALTAQLANGGRVAAVVRDRGGVCRATVGRVVGDDIVGLAVIEIPAPLLPGFERAREFVF